MSLGVLVLQQPVLPLDMSVIEQAVPALDIQFCSSLCVPGRVDLSVQQQPVLC
jgi:hypothetical protein